MTTNDNNRDSIQVLEPEASPAAVIVSSGAKYGGKPRARTGRKKRQRRLPPGQRLIKYTALAWLLTLTLPWLHQMATGGNHAAGNAMQVRLEPPFELSEELTDVSNALKELNSVKTTHPGVFAIEISTGKYVNLNGRQPYSAASMIKIPILVSFLSACDKGECKMTDILKIREDLKTNGSGFLQWRKDDSEL
ncbi:MAG: class A beta-lactamase-related serine hydrolase, partial [Candidatus Obscuribacterales bacterium]|nr:class A beta-lactamase-related serine hydrolase [Candidatus Obscuribacterales bacterium]